jgi:DUF4097 and DUF4098 domain-containing protein YvlB
MKKVLNTTIALILVLIFQAQAQDREPFLSKTFSKEAIKKVFARTSGGSITVEGGATTPKVEVYIQGNNGRDLSKAEIKERLDEDYEMIVDVANDELTVSAKPKDKFFNWKRALNISFKVYIQEKVSTDLETSGGSIDMKNLTGDLYFSTSGGSLDLYKLGGKIKGRTSGGSIEISDSKGEYIDLSTSGGGVTAKNCIGKITLSTSGGSIRLEDLQGTVKANTSGGPIRGSEIKGSLTAHTSGGGIDLKALACSLDVSTSGGSMDIQIDVLTEYVTARNSGGNIRVALPSNKGVDLKLRADRISISNMSNFNGDKDEHSMDGKLNGGGVPVNIQTSGSISLALN